MSEDDGKSFEIVSISFKKELLTKLDSQRGTAGRSKTINKILEHILQSETYVPSMVRDLQKKPQEAMVS